MLDFTGRQQRYLPVKLRNGVKIDLEEPTMQILREIEGTRKKNSAQDLIRVARQILSRNKQKRKFTNEEIAEVLTAQDMFYLFHAYMEFAGDIQSDPN